MTSVSSTRSSSPPRQAPRSEGQRPAAKPDDVAAMRDALAAAKHKLAKSGPKGQQPAELPEAPRGKTEERGSERSRAPTQAERQADGQGIGLVTAVAPPPIQLPQMPAAHVDPSGFAQMLADLWTRENGKGAKEVRVRFGGDAWPATGARLVRNAAGALDVALQIDPAGRGRATGTEGLREHLSAAGLQVGAVALDEEATI